MKQRNDGLFLLHIAEALDKVQRYTQSGKETFLRDSMIQDAVIRNFEIVGEAVKGLSAALRKKHPEVDWAGMAGFRDILIHQYFGIDLENVWEIVNSTAANAKQYIENMPEYKAFQQEMKNIDNE